MNKPVPLVSVQMPNRNNEAFLREAIESVLNQSHTTFEFLVVDDASTDGSWELIQQYASSDSRMRVAHNSEQLGIVYTRNKLFSLSSPHVNYYAIFDSDDICHVKRIARQVEFLENNPDYGIVGSNITVIDSHSKSLGTRNYSEQVGSEIYLKAPFAHPSIMIRKSLIEQFGGYSPEFEACEDWELYFRLLSSTRGHNIQESLLSYRLSENQQKAQKLKLTLQNSIKLKWQKMLRAGYFHPKAWLRLGFEQILLLLPKRLVLWLFKRVELKQD